MAIDYVLKGLGNVKPEYRNPERFSGPRGHIRTPKLVLKKYDMYVGEPSDSEKLDNMERFVIKEIEDGRIDPRIGLGFTIFSRDMINVVRWDNKFPIVAVNNLYEFSDRDKDYLRPTKLDVGNFGAYCVWELGIVDHERKAWIKYLNSNRTEHDKVDYVFNFLLEGLK